MQETQLEKMGQTDTKWKISAWMLEVNQTFTVSAEDMSSQANTDYWKGSQI